MKRSFSILILLAFTATQAFADWKIIINTISSEGDEYVSTFYIKDGVLRQESAQMDIIINLNTNSFIYTNHASSSYWSGTKGEFQNELEEMMDMMMVEMMGEEAYAEMKKMDESNEALDDGGEAFEIEISLDGESVDLAGYTGTKYSVIVNGELAEELWLCKEIDAFSAFDFEEMSTMFGEEGEGEESYTDSDQYLDMLKNNGFPIREITYAYGEMMETVELVSAEETTLSSEIFEAPADYKKVGLLQVMGAGQE